MLTLFQETPVSAQEQQAPVAEQPQDLDAAVPDRLPLTDQDEAIAPGVVQETPAAFAPIDAVPASSTLDAVGLDQEDTDSSSAPSSLESQDGLSTSAAVPSSVIVESQEVPSPDSASFIVTATSQEPEQQQAVFEVIEGGRQEALLSSQSPIPEDREDGSEGGAMEVMEAAKAAASMSSEAATGDNGVVFGNGGVVVGVGEEEEGGGLNGGDDFILKTPANSADPSDELIKPPEPVIQKATVDLLYDNEEPSSVALKRPEDVVNDLLSGGGDDDLLLDTKNSGLHDQKEEEGQFEVKNDQFEVKNDPFEVKNDPFEVTNNQFEVQDATLNVGDDPFKIGNQPADVKEVPFEVRDEASEVKDVPFEVKADPFEEPTEVSIVPRDVQSDLMEDKIDPLAGFSSAPTEVKQGC